MNRELATEATLALEAIGYVLQKLRAKELIQFVPKTDADKQEIGRLELLIGEQSVAIAAFGKYLIERAGRMDGEEKVKRLFEEIENEFDMPWQTAQLCIEEARLQSHERNQE